MSLFQSASLTFRTSFKAADLRGKGALFLAVWFGAGLLPKAPGTFGTLFAVPLVFLMNVVEPVYGGLFLLIFMAVAIRISDQAQKRLGDKDPPEVVIDEAAGFLLTMFLLPHSWFCLLLGFIFFRFFDISKPYPIKRLEKIKGGLGIVLDDLLAGVYANLAVRIVLFSLSTL